MDLPVVGHMETDPAFLSLKAGERVSDAGAVQVQGRHAFAEHDVGKRAVAGERVHADAVVSRLVRRLLVVRDQLRGGDAGAVGERLLVDVQVPCGDIDRGQARASIERVHAYPHVLIGLVDGDAALYAGVLEGVAAYAAQARRPLPVEGPRAARALEGAGQGAPAGGGGPEDLGHGIGKHDGSLQAGPCAEDKARRTVRIAFQVPVQDKRPVLLR